MRTYLVKLQFDKVSRERVLETLTANKEAWNRASQLNFDSVCKQTGHGLVNLHRSFYKEFRQKHPEIPSQIVIKAEQDVVATFNTIKANKHRIKKAPIKKKLSMQLDKRIYRVSGNEISLTGIGKGRIKGAIMLYPRLQEALSHGFRDPKIFERNGEIWLAIPVETPKPLVFNNSCIGVDLGIKRAATTTEGLFISRKSFNRRLRKFSFTKRKLQAKKTKSARKRLKKLSRRHHNMSKDFTHCCVNKILATKSNVIVIEWLRSLKSKSRGKYMNRRLSQWAYGEFRRILEYKAQALGKRVVTVNPAFTSQRDWRGIPDGKRQGCRYYASDGKVFDADWNAAMNIANLHSSISKIPVSGMSSHQQTNATDRQATVISPHDHKPDENRLVKPYNLL